MHTCGEHIHVHDRIIALVGEDWAGKLFELRHFYVPVPSQQRKPSCICVLELSILPPSEIFLYDFGIVPTWYFFAFHFYYKQGNTF